MEYLRSVIQQKLGVKDSREIVRYLPAIIMLSVVTTLTYFYYNAFSPVLSLMANEFGFSEEERDTYLGIFVLYGLIRRESLKHDILLCWMSLLFVIFLYCRLEQS